MRKLLVIFMLMLMLPAAGAHADEYHEYAPTCEPIRAQVELVLADVGASPEYYYLLVAESHCNPGRVSSAGAVGLWQMMPRTARKFGCDDATDLVCVTRAAGRYLLHLEQKCGHEAVVYCWHDGGSNFLRNGRRPSTGARGLKWHFDRLRRRL